MQWKELKSFAYTYVRRVHVVVSEIYLYPAYH